MRKIAKKKEPHTGNIRLYKVLKLFIDIFWAFYSLKYKTLWHRAGWLEKKKAELYVSQAVYFRETAVALGGLLIKLGQFLSVRVDLLPSVTIEELAKLQDEVQGVEFAELKAFAEQELGQPLEQVFAWVNPEPIAAASLGQVHKVGLVCGEEAALKIQRPNIQQLITIDLRALKRVVQFIKRFTNWDRFMDIDLIFEEFATTMEAELDYIQEGKNAERIQKNFQEDPDIRIPKIYWDYTTSRVLTMEFMPGIKVNDLEAIVAAGLDPQFLAQRLLQIYIKQILLDGFYHADPHPGNLFVAEGNQIILLDFGMVGEIKPTMRDQLMEMVFALVGRDFAKVNEYLKILGFVKGSANDSALIRALSIFVEQFLGQATDLSQMDFTQLFADLEELLYEQPFQLPANFTFLGRALGTLYGICIKLNPEISFIDEAKPFVDQLSPASQSIWKVIKEKAGNIGSALTELPLVMERVFTKADHGDLEIKITAPGIRDQMEANTQALRGLGYILGFGVTFICGVYLFVHQFTQQSYFVQGISLLFFLLFLRNGRKRKQQRRRGGSGHPSRRSSP